MQDISKKIFILGLVSLIILRFITVFLLMNDIPWTDMRLNGFRPHFEGSYWPDESQYFNLAKSLTDFKPVPVAINLGYPLFLAPIVYLTGAADPIGVTKAVFIIQAFLFFGLAIILVALISLEILKKRKLAIFSAFMFTIYPYMLYGILKLANFSHIIPAFHYQMWIVIGADYLSAILLYFGFYLFIKKYNSGGLNFAFAAAIGAVIAMAALARMANILYLPLIFLVFIWLKKYRESVTFGLTAFLVYLPQWIYNFYFFGSPLTYGYRIPLIGFAPGSKIIGDWFSFENVFIFFSRIWQNLPAFIWILPFFVLIITAGFWRLFKQEKHLTVILGFWILLNIGFYIFFVATQSQLRYFIPSIPPLIILFISGFLWARGNLKKWLNSD